MYYPTDSLKARCCVRGLELMYDYCARRGVAHRRTGKLIVATDELDRDELRALSVRADANGVETRWIEGDEAMRLEPALRCVAALDSPNSGIVDVPELITALIGDLQHHGGQLLCRTEVHAVTVGPSWFRIGTAGGDTLHCRRLVNAAGLGATELAARIDGLAPAHVPRLWYGQGHYYNLRGRSPFQRLIYPLPGAASLGVHLGMDISGRCRFGPDMRWVDAPTYQFDDSQRGAFAESIRQWWPALRDEDLTPDFVGVRPKIAGPGQAGADFVVQGPVAHGIDGLINLFGIESPGLTSSLALAEEVVSALRRGTRPAFTTT
jgi:L-2-hydroxyglutarate oxidase LhgO